MFCKHNYMIIDKTILESGLEQALKSGINNLSSKDIITDSDFSRRM